MTFRITEKMVKQFKSKSYHKLLGTDIYLL